MLIALIQSFDQKYMIVLQGFIVMDTNCTLPSTRVVWDRLGRVGTVDSGIGFEKLFGKLTIFALLSQEGKDQ